eukprot:868475-Lingulodinium_polyedra.AAC.1
MHLWAERHEYKLIIPEKLECPECFITLSTFEQLQDHICARLPPLDVVGGPVGRQPRGRTRNTGKNTEGVYIGD